MLSKFCKFNEINIKEAFLKNESLESVKNKIDEDDESVIKKIKQGSFNILFDDEGETLSSKNFAIKLEKIFDKNCNVNFIIGGSYGVGEKVKKKANQILSLSKLTFSHELARVIFYEQLFRSFKILKGEKYDK